MIDVSHLTKRFGSRVAVNDLSFSVKKGEIVGLLGPNGAGKTTTMRLVTGFLTPDSGAVTVAGHDVLTDPLASQARIGYMPESNPLYRDMLVSEFLGYSAALKQIPKSKRKKAFDSAVAAANIAEVFFRPISELSKGFRQRVGLACALLANPDILILDEPTEGLDPNQRTEVRSLIKNLAKDHTVILSTHVLQEVTAMCDRIIIIHKGRLAADGTAEALTKQAAGQTLVAVDIEGTGVVDALKGLPGVTDVRVAEHRGKRVRASVTTSHDIPLQPALSAAAREQGWVLWHVSEERRGLEEVFKQLTNA